MGSVANYYLALGHLEPRHWLFCTRPLTSWYWAMGHLLSDCVQFRTGQFVNCAIYIWTVNNLVPERWPFATGSRIICHRAVDHLVPGCGPFGSEQLINWYRGLDHLVLCRESFSTWPWTICFWGFDHMLSGRWTFRTEPRTCYRTAPFSVRPWTIWYHAVWPFGPGLLTIPGCGDIFLSGRSSFGTGPFGHLGPVHCLYPDVNYFVQGL